MKKDKETGWPITHSKIQNKESKSITTIRGIFKCWQKAPKFVLRLEADEIRIYLGKDLQLTNIRKDAMRFAHGFDDRSVKAKYWSERLKLKFKPENI